ncbi:response regulator transcription factor [Chryseosolibacter indicus]|uniref:Response regulator transcription factor n=1 Tax=Chryseosolibacter indicus TaxID=2782351 RepID=A0ABS5VM60_9BACT|nr:response regulator transcription factor [Chryseosolibacter indicus]MBT1702534.1 response regulator transcription factor [Chryseosolibacter indicus]
MIAKQRRILVVDDDSDIVELLKYNLERQGFKVKTLRDSDRAIEVANSFVPDLIILDIMMPQPNGIEVCRKLRTIKKFENTYIFFLTANSEPYYRNAVMNTGADDFIEKVIGLRALTYKVSAVLKKQFIIRKGITEVTIGQLTVNRKTSTVTISNNIIALSPPELEILFFFAQNPNKIISTEDMVHNIWGSEIYLFDTSVEACIRNLRKKIGEGIIEDIKQDCYKLSAKNVLRQSRAHD